MMARKVKNSRRGSGRRIAVLSSLCRRHRVRHIHLRRQVSNWDFFAHLRGESGGGCSTPSLVPSHHAVRHRDTSACRHLAWQNSAASGLPTSHACVPMPAGCHPRHRHWPYVPRQALRAIFAGVRLLMFHPTQRASRRKRTSGILAPEGERGSNVSIITAGITSDRSSMVEPQARSRSPCRSRPRQRMSNGTCRARCHSPICTTPAVHRLRGSRPERQINCLLIPPLQQRRQTSHHAPRKPRVKACELGTMEASTPGLARIVLATPKNRSRIMGLFGCGKTTFVAHINGLHLMTFRGLFVSAEGTDTTMDIVGCTALISAWCSRPTLPYDDGLKTCLLAGRLRPCAFLARKDRSRRRPRTKSGCGTKSRAKLFAAGTSLREGSRGCAHDRQSCCSTSRPAPRPEVDGDHRRIAVRPQV